MKNLSLLSLLVSLTILVNCGLFKEDPCELTSEPLTSSNLITNPADLTYCGEYGYNYSVGFELFYVTGSCNTGVNGVWDLPAGSEFIGFDNGPSITARLGRSGEICALLTGADTNTERVCRTVTIHRNSVWGNLSPNFPEEADSRGITLTLNGDVYSGFGNGNTWHQFDTVAWNWVERGNISGLIDFTSYGGFAIGDYAYIVGNNSEYYRYDTQTHAWTRMGTFPENVLLSTRIGDATQAQHRFPVVGEAVNGKGYFGVGGFGTFWEYDPSADSWTKKADYPESENTWKHSFAFQGKIYVGKYMYLPESDEWKLSPHDFSLANEVSMKPVVFGGTAYFVQNGINYTFDGTIVRRYDVGRSRFCGERSVPVGSMFDGAVTGNLAIFPRGFYAQANGSLADTNISLYYVLR